MGAFDESKYDAGEAVAGEPHWRDLEFLAGELPHRGGITDRERRAAEYLAHRLEEYTPYTQIEDFYSIDAYPYLFAMYYAEFLFVGILSIWWPWVAFGYGLAVFLLYMAEFTGYSAMSRFLPHFETQNITARFPCENAKRLVVVTAHYDSPKAYPWTKPGWTKRIRERHLWLVVAMVAVIMTCGAQGFNVFAGQAFRIDLAVRGAAVLALLTAAGALYGSARRTGFTAGANNNASGTAVLLALAEKLQARPPESSEVLLVATGAKEMWLSGMRHLFRGLTVDKSSTFFLNVAGVGAGTLRYMTGEGMLHVYSAGRTLVRAAQDVGPAYGARPMVWRNLPTDALIPLARGYEAMTVTAIAENDIPLEWNRQTDTVGRVDRDVLNRATDFVEALVRRIDGPT